MRNKNVQMSLFDTYNDVQKTMEEEKSELISLLEKHIDFETLIPSRFHQAFYRRHGRPRNFSLVGLVKFCVLQKILAIPCDKTLLILLKISRELRDFCEFDKVPDASKITRFKQDFVKYIELMFHQFVEITEPICREIDAKKADYLIYDPTGIVMNVAENNPKFINTKLNNAKKLTKNNPNFNPYSYVYSSLPEASATNPFAQHQYINGHFCYAAKCGILTNGIGVIRDIAFFDESFKRRHPEVVTKKTDNPLLDKEIGDSVSLKPVLTDFFKNHSTFSYKTFLGDSSFDSYDIYAMLHNDFHFDRVAIPLNKRNTSSAHADFDDHGTPVCPIDKTPFVFLGQSGGKNRSRRFKWVCHKSVPTGSTRACVCEHPCTDSSYGRCVYTYPDKNFRFYPGIPRGTQHWDNLYKHRVLVERTINILKNDLGVACCKSFSLRTTKADLLFAGVTQLVGVILANAVNKAHLYKSLRKLIA